MTGWRQNEDGWLVRIEVVELRRIPDTTDVLATLRGADATPRVSLMSYERGATGTCGDVPEQ